MPSSELIAATASTILGALLILRARRRQKDSATVWEHHTCRLPQRTTADDRATIQQAITLADRSAYFALSCCPIRHEVEQRMEQISTIVSRENYNDHWDAGTYSCARCAHVLYDSKSKFVGPCLWPSYRTGVASSAAGIVAGLHTIAVPTGSYNQYTCDVREVYCGGCKLFLGHQFADGRTCGDVHPDAHWRHCVLSLSLSFSAASV